MKAFQFIRQAARRAVSIEVWVVALLAAGCVFSDRLLLPAVVAALVFWPLRWLAHGRLSLPTPLDWPAGALALLLPVTLLATPLPEISLPQVYHLLIGMALCYTIANHAWGPGGLRLALAGLVGLGVGLGLAALLTVDWFENKLTLIPLSLVNDLPRLIGEQVHPNVMAGALALLGLFAPAWLLFGGRKTSGWGRVLLLLAVGFVFGVLVLTKSRGAWAGLATGLAVLLVLRWPRWGSAAVLGVCLAGGVFLASNSGLAFELINGNVADMQVSSLAGREVIWTRALTQIRDFPLTGMGIGTFPQVTRALYPYYLGTVGDAPHAHDLYLQIAVDLGLPGLAAWLIGALVVVRCAWGVYRAGLRRAGWLAGLGAGLLAAQAAMAVHGLVDAVTWGTRPAVIVWGLWGLALAGWVMLRRDSSHGFIAK